MEERPDPIDVAEVAAFLRKFAEDREWVQFHTPKNLAMALAGEAGELLEIFQWLAPEQSRTVSENQDSRRALEDELADIVQYAIRLADVAGIDLNQALWNKLEANEDRYPIELSKGTARKYTDLDKDV